ncbi:uncharacterized protein LOC123523185 isoform X2 [Mercenaria mercenaria]|uniref:uncharacterized protein LOC123523185 isoform X2 n=1 Tax=Mercenaria mercenaria TaxID=6596 RepID=UPI00234F8869|nr:uncharacterized protein LOC123523185 isoform X2 [Mercenaria mercenaria]XP_053405227.1 uncharacterized protein LOC123523185 isoform X2 [Mercenaria mercenaria]
MFQAPDYTCTVSERLSEVLADIGVDERIVLKRRRAYMQIESIHNSALQLKDKKRTLYYLGSQSEGTTTLRLNSDTDVLTCKNNFNIVQDRSGWQPGVHNLLMIQDDTVSPGYCLLQRLRDDAPLPYNDVSNEHYFRDRTGRILLSNTLIPAALAAADFKGVHNGPAYTEPGQPGVSESDIVVAFPCKTWPLQARQWLDQQGVSRWLSDDMKRYCSNTGCFVVGVGSKSSENDELEWRISTSLAERCLMFNLNITQIRCYVLMKMILKTYIKPLYEGTITSFICKTVLFKVIANTHSNFWREKNLLVCLLCCLFVLYNSVLYENCPHFIIPGNNLIGRHITQQSKPHILEILQYIINSEGTALLAIKCEDLGAGLQLKLNYLLSFNTRCFVSGYILKTTAQMVDSSIDFCLDCISNSSHEEAIQKLLEYIFKLVTISNRGQGLEKTACRLLGPWFCTTLGSTLASLNIQQYSGISVEALTWISLGLNTDVSSSKLKLASMFYCIGDSNRTELVLRDIEGSYDQNIVEPVCCHYIKKAFRKGFHVISDNHNEEALQYATAFCVKFLPCEINCVPTELQYEMFRSTEEDLAFRGRFDNWMDWAVVDSLPYLYFLQYKTYSYLGRQDDKERTLSNLTRTIEQEPELGHKETALNLLGQCMEQEDRPTDALRCYLLSLNLRRRNNAAKFHICRLLSTIVNHQAGTML